MQSESGALLESGDSFRNEKEAERATTFTPSALDARFWNNAEAGPVYETQFLEFWRREEGCVSGQHLSRTAVFLFFCFKQGQKCWNKFLFHVRIILKKTEVFYLKETVRLRADQKIALYTWIFEFRTERNGEKKISDSELFSKMNFKVTKIH